MQNPLQVFDVNEKGRDFAIGDLHGSLSALARLLHELNFDESVDRMFSVGDLVDRGPDSHGTLQLLREPWFKAVISNHEQLMLDAFDGNPMGGYWYDNGGFWGAQAMDDWKSREVRAESDMDPKSLELFENLKLVRELPFMITVKLPGDKKVHIIHAELPPTKLVTDVDLEDPEKVRDFATLQTRNGDVFTWGRYLFGAFNGQDLSNPGMLDKIRRSVAYNFASNNWTRDVSPIISGHTIMQRPLTILGRTNLDTGAYGSYSTSAKSWQQLTCLDLKEWKFYQATETTFREVQPLELTWEDMSKSWSTPLPPVNTDMEKARAQK